MSLLVIDISDKIEELGILFANLLEDCLFNESVQLQYDLNRNDHEQQDPISSPAENSLCLPQAIDHVPGYAQSGEYRAGICPQPESHRLWMESFTSPDPGWRSWPFGQQYCRTGRLQDPGSGSINGKSWGHICTGSLTAFQKFCRLEPPVRTLFAYPDADHRSGWLLRPGTIKRSVTAWIEGYNVAGRTSSNKGTMSQAELHLISPYVCNLRFAKVA
jgi:hypothetical protein